MKQGTKEKLEKIVELVNNIMVDCEINVSYCIPDVAMDAKTCNVSGDPYIIIEYVLSEYDRPTRKIYLNQGYLKDDAEVVANLVTFSVQQFKMEIDSVQMG